MARVSALRGGRRGGAGGLGRAAGRLVLDALLEDVERLAGQEQVTLLEDVVGVEVADRRDLDPGNIPRAAMEQGVVGGQADQDRAALERPLACLRLGLADCLGSLSLGEVRTADRPQN